MDDDQDKQQQHPPGYPTEMLYVIETIELTKSESSTSSEAFKLTLLPGNLSTSYLQISTKTYIDCSEYNSFLVTQILLIFIPTM